MTAVAVESSSLEWKVGYRMQQRRHGDPRRGLPELLWIVDPNDYLRPIVFDVITPLGQVAPPAGDRRPVGAWRAPLDPPRGAPALGVELQLG